MKKYYNISPIECFESYLNKDNTNIHSWECTKGTGLIYTFSDKHLYEMYDNEIESMDDDEEFNDKSLIESLKIYPYISLLTTFNNTSKVEPIYIVTYIQDINGNKIETYEGIELEAYEFEYDIWCNKVIGYSIIRPINLIEFIIDSVSLTRYHDTAVNFKYANTLNIDLDTITIEDEMEMVFENLNAPFSVKEKKSIEICKKVFPNAMFNFLIFE